MLVVFVGAPLRYGLLVLNLCNEGFECYLVCVERKCGMSVLVRAEIIGAVPKDKTLSFPFVKVSNTFISQTCP